MLVAGWGFPHGSYFEKAVGKAVHGTVNPAEPSPLRKPEPGEDASKITQGQEHCCQSMVESQESGPSGFRDSWMGWKGPLKVIQSNPLQ